MSRIVLYGATGYTGRLTAAALVARGIAPVLAGRNRAALTELAAHHGGLDTAVADVSDPSTVCALVGPGDVLLSTVGPFAKYGAPAAEAAVEAGAQYLDSTGEPVFIRRVFEEWGPRARAAGTTMLTAFGYDYVPGNLAAALAVEEAGSQATSVDVSYAIVGGTKASAGTLASVAGVLVEPGFAYRGGQLRTVPTGYELIRQRVRGSTTFSLSLSATEQFSLPRVYPQLRDVRVGMSAGLPTPAVWGAGRLTQLSLKIPGARELARRTLVDRVQGSGGGPSDEYNRSASSRVVATAKSASGAQVAQVVLHGPSPYPFTAEILAWGAERLAAGVAKDVGALGPVEAFGVDELESSCAAIGLRRS
ncbi:MAG: saccharopine dehydrogenase family protein [Mycobacterium sp.]